MGREWDERQETWTAQFQERVIFDCVETSKRKLLAMRSTAETFRSGSRSSAASEFQDPSWEQRSGRFSAVPSGGGTASLCLALRLLVRDTALPRFVRPKQEVRATRRQQHGLVAHVRRHDLHTRRLILDGNVVVRSKGRIS